MFSQQHSPGGSIHSQLLKTSFLDLMLEPILCQTKLAHKLLQPTISKQDEQLTNSGLQRPKTRDSAAHAVMSAEFTSYDVVSTPEGFREFKSVVHKLAGYRLGEEGFEGGILEHQTVSLLRYIIIEPDEGLASTLFELFDFDSKSRMDLSHFYVLFTLVSAIESKKLMEFQYKFGRLIFDMLGAKLSQISFDKLVTFAGLVFDKSVVELQRMLQRIGIERDQPVSFTDYELFMFDSITTEYKTKDIDARTFLYEYYMSDKRGRYSEMVKKSNKGGLAPNKMSTVSPMQSQSPLKCNLI